jgi:hypothetical protein
MDVICHNGPIDKARRILAVVICLCYVFNPVLPGLKGVFHSLSHALEMQDLIITHSAELAGSPGQPHELQDHVPDLQQHEHEIIDFITCIDGSSETKKEPSGPASIEKYLDKHLVGTPELVPDIACGNSRQTFRALSFIAMRGFPGNSLKPPIG